MSCVLMLRLVQLQRYVYNTIGIRLRNEVLKTHLTQNIRDAHHHHYLKHCISSSTTREGATTKTPTPICTFNKIKPETAEKQHTTAAEQTKKLQVSDFAINALRLHLTPEQG